MSLQIYLLQYEYKKIIYFKHNPPFIIFCSQLIKLTLVGMRKNVSQVRVPAYINRQPLKNNDLLECTLISCCLFFFFVWCVVKFKGNGIWFNNLFFQFNSIECLLYSNR